VQTIISTLIILFFAEFIPKNLFNTHSDAALTVFALPAWVFYMLFYPIVSFIIGISNFMLKHLFKVEIPEGEPVFTRLDLDDLLKKHTDSVAGESEVDPEIEILQNALGFSERKAREFMVPRTEIVALELNDTVERLTEAFVKNGYSKVIIYKKNIDNIIGYVHSYDMFSKPETIKEVLRPNLFVPESMKANEVLNLFTRERKGLTIVLDEFGGTSGLITLEDVVEEIVGEIDDEHDADSLLEKELSESTYLFAARLEINYLNNKYKFDLPEGDNYETLGGLIIDIHESIPETGEIIAFEKYQFEINKVSSNRIEEVVVTVLPS
jgi:CBS domain containing-hemolysin-like protein